MKSKKFIILGIFYLLIIAWYLVQGGGFVFSLPDGVRTLIYYILPILLVGILALVDIFLLSKLDNRYSTISFRFQVLMILCGLLSPVLLLVAWTAGEFYYIFGTILGMASFAFLVLSLFYAIRASSYKPLLS